MTNIAYVCIQFHIDGFALRNFDICTSFFSWVKKKKEKTTNKNRTFTGLVDGFARWLVSNSIASEMHGNSRYNYHENGETSTKPF